MREFPLSQITNLAFFNAQLGQAQALGTALLALVDPTRAEPECLRYDVHQSLDEPGSWFVYEEWNSLGGLDAHLQAPHVQAFIEAAPGIVAGDIEQRRFSMVSKRAPSRT